jgi:catechol 2,3-dioxygenase-like lactoylglutathione lyase family enzyme
MRISSSRAESKPSRRTAIQMVAAGLGLSQAKAADFSPSAFDHMEFWVSDVVASANFYCRLFGADRLKNKQTQRRYVKLGSAYLAMDHNEIQAIRVDHFCAGIPNFQIAAVHDYLNQRSIAYRDYPSGRDTAVTEPSGLRLQLSGDHGWDSLVAGTGAPEDAGLTSAPVFQPVGIESIMLRVNDLAASTSFFEQVFGASKPAEKLRWFQVGTSKLGLRSVEAAESAAVDYIRLSARPFSADAVSPMVTRLGATAVRVISPNEVEFADPDHYRLRVAAI